MKPSSVAVKAWLLAMSPAIAYARHHPVHGATNGRAALWILLGLLALVGIVAWSTRKRKKWPIRKKKKQ
jgi:hypothetical protein